MRAAKAAQVMLDWRRNQSAPDLALASYGLPISTMAYSNGSDGTSQHPRVKLREFYF
jgi:hypothetical protein